MHAGAQNSRGGNAGVPDLGGLLQGMMGQLFGGTQRQAARQPSSRVAAASSATTAEADEALDVALAVLDPEERIQWATTIRYACLLCICFHCEQAMCQAFLDGSMHQFGSSSTLRSCTCALQPVSASMQECYPHAGPTGRHSSLMPLFQALVRLTRLALPQPLEVTS